MAAESSQLNGAAELQNRQTEPMPANLAEESLEEEHPFGMVAPSFVEKELPQIGIDHRSVYIYIY